jgi:hypothetical protein
VISLAFIITFQTIARVRVRVRVRFRDRVRDRKGRRVRVSPNSNPTFLFGDKEGDGSHSACIHHSLHDLEKRER